MDLAQITHNINLAKLDNARWLEYANEMINGSTVTKEGIPKYKDECIPCQWLYDHSDEVSKLYQKLEQRELNLFDFDIMEEIEALRYDFHESYLQIFKILLPELNHSFFGNLFKSKKPASDYEKVKAKREFIKMQKIKETLDIKLEYLERSVYHFCKLNIA